MTEIEIEIEIKTEIETQILIDLKLNKTSSERKRRFMSLNVDWLAGLHSKFLLFYFPSVFSKNFFFSRVDSITKAAIIYYFLKYNKSLRPIIKQKYIPSVSK